MKTATRLPGLLLLLLTLGGCASLDCWTGCHRQEHNASSLVDFLYPGKAVPPKDNAVPELHLPLRVGLAFLPPDGRAAPVLDEAHKLALLEQVRRRFMSRKFVADIQIVPDYYLQRDGHFDGLAAVQGLFKLDLIALVSYDQMTHEDSNGWSLGYLTIVGSAVLKGTQHDVSTLVDLAVVDPASRSLVLRAGGVDVQHGHSTLLNESAQQRELQARGFDLATTQMIQNFDTALLAFEHDVREGHGSVRIASGGGGGGGGGAFDGITLVLLAAVLAMRLRQRRQRRVRG